MNINQLFFVTATVLLFSPPCSSCFAQGSLTPPGAPAQTMKSLDQIEPRTPISFAPYTITNPGSYYVTTNLLGVSDTNAITISANYVTLDLSGFVLSAATGSTYGSGVYVAGIYTNITIRNGTITGWSAGAGVDTYNGGPSSAVAVENVSVSGSLYAILVGANSMVRDCLSEKNYAGINCQAGQVANCVVRGSSLDGITIQNGTVCDCRVEACGNGINADASTVSDCLVLSNGLAGIDASGPDCQIVGNNCRANNQRAVGSDAGILIASSGNRVEANHVSGNIEYGILIASEGNTNNVIIRNTVSGDGSANYSIPSGNAYGPIVAGSGVITSNALANFSY